jgi:hypothetical protein
MIWWSNACLVAMAALALIVTCISYTVFSEVVLRRSTVRRCLSYTMYDIGLVIQHIDDIWPCDEDSQCLLVIFVGDLCWGPCCIKRHLH